MFCWYAREKWGFSTVWWHVRTALRFALWDYSSGRKELCMMPCHSCYIYGIWTSRSKKVWGMLKSHQLGVASHRRGTLFVEKAGSHYIICPIVSLPGSVKDFIRYLFTILLLFCVWGWQGQKYNSRCPNDINTNSRKTFMFFTLLLKIPEKTPLNFPHNFVTPFRNFKATWNST